MSCEHCELSLEKRERKKVMKQAKKPVRLLCACTAPDNLCCIYVYVCVLIVDWCMCIYFFEF